LEDLFCLKHAGHEISDGAPLLCPLVVILFVLFALLRFGELTAHAQNPGLDLIEGQRLVTLTNDTDGDNIFDEREMLLGTNPQDADTDHDNFDDFFEDTARYFGFDPLVANSDADQDGLSDAFEAQLGTNPLNADTDNDGYTDFDEVLNERFGYNPLQPSMDTDFDGLTDNLEAAIGTAVNAPDSDGDGLSDFAEFDAGLNPRQFDPPESTGELAGTTHSANMEAVILAMRQGGSFPANLAGSCPIRRSRDGSTDSRRPAALFKSSSGRRLRCCTRRRFALIIKATIPS
jgi:hypothetical protein